MTKGDWWGVAVAVAVASVLVAAAIWAVRIGNQRKADRRAAVQMCQAVGGYHLPDGVRVAGRDTVVYCIRPPVAIDEVAP